MGGGAGAGAGRPSRDAVCGARGRPGLREDEQVDRVRPPFRGDLGSGAAGGAGARGAVRLSARDVVDSYRRGVGRRGAGLCDSLLLDAAQRAFARADGSRGNQFHSGLDRSRRDSLDHDHPAGGAGVGGGEGAGGESVGRVHRGRNDPDRDVHGWLSALVARGARAGRLDDRRGAAATGGVGRQAGARGRGLGAVVHARRGTARVVDHHLRSRGERTAGVVAAGTARLSQHVHEARHNLRARVRRARGAAGYEDAGGDEVHRWLGPRGAGRAFPVLFHHHRVRGDLRLPYTYRQRHHAEDHHARRLREANWLRRDVTRIACGDHGDHRRVHPGSGHLSRYERGRRPRRHGGEGAGRGLRSFHCADG